MNEKKVKNSKKTEKPDYTYQIDGKKLTFIFKEGLLGDEKTLCVILKHISEIILTKIDKDGWKNIKIFCTRPDYATMVYNKSNKIDKLYKEIIERLK